jgi:hypothetical protein
MFTETIWKVGLYNIVSRYPAISVRCGACNASGMLPAPLEKIFDGRKERRGTVAMGVAEARAFQFKHHPTCRGIAAQYAAVDAAEKDLNAPKHQIYLLQTAVDQAASALDRGYISKLPVVELSQLSDKLQAANVARAQGSARLKPLIERLEANVTVTKTALETARGESAPENILAEFEKAMARYLPQTDVQEPTPPGTQRVNGHLLEVF